MTRTFSSKFAADINGMRKWRINLGYTENTYDFYLRQFDNFCLRNHPLQDVLTWEISIEYLNEVQNRRDIRLDVVTLRHLAKYQQMIGKPACIFPKGFFSYRDRRQPYMMSDSDLKRFFDATDHYPPDAHNPLIAYTAAVIFRLQYATGMRPQEVRLLSRLDINFSEGTIYIADSKRHKDRRIAVNKELLRTCQQYDVIARKIYPHTTCFFPSRNKKPHSNASLRDLFLKCWNMSGNPKGPGYCSPYILRHNYATRRIASWLEQGKNIDEFIPYLSAYMGHTTFRETYYYIHLLPNQFTITGLMGLSGIVPEVRHEK